MSNLIKFNRITPTEYKKMKNFEIVYGIVGTKFGNCLIGIHNNSLCYLSLYDDDSSTLKALEGLKSDWPRCALVQNNEMIQTYMEHVFEKKKNDVLPLRVLLKGTDFQCNVWMELTKLQEGSTVSYEYIAKALGQPKAVRGVANAIAKNKLAYVIPCHRVICKNGVVNKYRWGADRKKKMLNYESVL